MSDLLRFRVHYTWIFVVALLTVMITTQFSEDYRLLQRIILGVVVSLLFLVFTLVREFILNLASFHADALYQKISLFAFGGVYPLYRDRLVSHHLPLLYAARYLSNLALAAIFYGIYATFINAGNLTAAGVAQWLVYIYTFVFLIHFVPAFPLDAGLILRKVLWRTSRDYYESTRIAALIGLAVALFLIFVGVLVLIITQEWSISLLIVLSGWILQSASGDIRRQIKTLITLREVKAEDIMTREYPIISTQVNIRQLVRENILKQGRVFFMVVEDGKLKGILTLQQIKAVPARHWNNTTVKDIMTPSPQVRTALPQQPAALLYEEMFQRNLDYLPVLENDRLSGVVIRSSLVGLANVRSGFGV